MWTWSEICNFFKPIPPKPVTVQPPLPQPVPNTSLTLPQCGIDLIKQVEGFRPSAYLDTRGIPTIGYGHTKGIRIGDTCTSAQAEAWLKFDVTWAWEAVCRNVKVPLTSYQGGALLSFVFNLGEPQFKDSGVLRELNLGNYGLVPSEIGKWVWETLPDKTRRINQGLVNRRKLEADLWKNNDWRVS